MSRPGRGGSAWVAFGLVCALVFGSAAECEKRGKQPTTNRPAEDHKVDPRNVREVRIEAHSREVPYEVLVDVYDEKGGHDGSQEIVTSAAGNYRQTITYTSGRRLKVLVEVKPPRRGSGAYCKVTDGPRNVVVVGPENRGFRSTCELITNR